MKEGYQTNSTKEKRLTLILAAVLILLTIFLVLGIRLSSPNDEEDPFPHGLHSCIRCPYFHHAQSDPEHALTSCPTCGLTLLPQEELA